MKDPRIEDALAFWRKQEGKPYYRGAEGPLEWDCSGLFRRGLMAGCLWPYAGDANVDMIWAGPEFVKVKWDERQPGDGVIYGDTQTGDSQHLVCVLSETELIGANSGFGKRENETDDDYRRRIAERRARVKITDHNYWWAARLGVVRSSLLFAPVKMAGDPSP